MKIKVIFIDVGGVLVLSTGTQKRRAWEKKLGIEPHALTETVPDLIPASLATIGKISSQQIWNSISQKISVTGKDLEKLKEDYFAGDQLNTQLYDFIKKIRNNYQVVIASNGWDEVRSVYADIYHLDRITDKMIISSEIGMIKPEKDFYDYALDLMHVEAGEAIFIDDSIENIAAAEELGFNTILFSDTVSAIEEIKKYLDRS